MVDQFVIAIRLDLCNVVVRLLVVGRVAFVLRREVVWMVVVVVPEVLVLV